MTVGSKIGGIKPSFSIDRMVEISKKAKQQRTLAIISLFFLTIIIGIVLDANSKKEGWFSDEAKLLRACKNSAKSQLLRKPKIESAYGDRVYASGLNAFGMRMTMGFKCTDSGYAQRLNEFGF